MSEESASQKNGINRHFRREGRIMVLAAIGVPIILMVVLWVLAPLILPALGR